MKKKKFVKHFRIYFKNGHPAYIVDEDGNKFVFHRIDNPLIKGGDKVTYIVKREEKDNKGRFSLFELETKPNLDIDNLLIKKAGGSQPIGTNNLTTSVDDGKSKTLTHRSDSSSTSIKSKQKKKGKKNGKL